MQHWLVRLWFAGPIHFGEAGIGDETTNVTLRSDSLYSAIWSIWGRYGLQPAIDDLLARFTGEGEAPFLLSSTFLFEGDTYYLPRPSLPAQGLEQHGKIVKQTRCVPLALFRAWTSGLPVDPEALEKANQRVDELYARNLRPRVHLDRVSERAQLYQVAQVTFAEGAGLWFLIRVRDAGVLAPLRQAVALLGEDGLGGRRSAGYGCFRPEWEDVTAHSDWRALFGDNEADGPHCLLSVCNPEPPELPGLLTDASYEVVERTGWASSGDGRAQAPRLPVRMLAEGSVLSGRPRGRVVDVTPPAFLELAGHRIYRSGLALAVPVRREART